MPISDILTPRVVNILISNSLTVLLAEVLFALYPLFGYTPRASGGLGLTEAQIGAHMSIRAVIHVGSMLAYPWADRRWGTLKLYKACSALWPLNIALFPLAGFITRRYDDPDAPAVWAAVLLLFSVWSLTSFTWGASASDFSESVCANLTHPALACLSILVNDSAPFPEALARLNGTLQRDCRGHRAPALTDGFQQLFCRSRLSFRRPLPQRLGRRYSPSRSSREF